MPTAKGLRKFGAPANNQMTVAHAIYDFAADGGAAGTYDLIEIDGDCLLHRWWAVVETAVTSTGSATVGAGYTGATTQFLSAVAKTSFTANSVQKPDSVTGDVPVRLTDGAYLTLTIATAPLSAGKIHVFAELGSSWAGD
jgi:hypothetical protein